MKKPLTYLIVALLGFSVLAAIQPVSGDYSVDIFITDAYYGDLDSDGLEDDIWVDLDVYVTNNQVYTDIEIFVGLELPSGMEFWFSSEFTVVKYSQTGYLQMTWNLLDTALEPGWYWAYAVGFADGENYSYMDSFLFDPPGQTGGLNPS